MTRPLAIVAAVAEKVLPSTVQIVAEYDGKAQGATGSGFVLDDQGHVITNNHVVAEADEGRRLGFDGKSLIHPAQIAPCNAAFAPGEAELDRARRLVDAFDGGAERFEDAMVEAMHVDAARLLLERAAR